MEQFVVSARKYRPQTFKDVVGQQAITNTLLNAIETNHLASALLFVVVSVRFVVVVLFLFRCHRSCRRSCRQVVVVVVKLLSSP